MPPGIGPANKVKINGKDYWLKLVGSDPVYGTGSRALQDVPSDHFSLVLDDWSGGVGDKLLSSEGLLTHLPGRIYPAPVVTSFATLNPIFAEPIGNRGYSFEEQDSNGVWYKYFLFATKLTKVELVDGSPFGTIATVVNERTLTGLPGQPVKASHGGTFYWYIPLNNGNNVAKLTSPVADESASAAYSPVVTLNGAINASVTSLVYTSTGDPISQWDVLLIGTENLLVTAINTGTNTATVARGYAGTTAASHIDTSAITKQGGDTVSTITTIVGGASHFRVLPSGKIWRSLASHSSGTFNNTAKVSALVTTTAFETDANWGQDFPTDDQSIWISDLLSWDELLVIRKQNGWFTALENVDGSITWRSVLPDGEFRESATYANEKATPGTVWQGQLMLPSPNGLSRHRGFAAAPKGPDTIRANIGDLPSVPHVRFGYVANPVACGRWLHAIYRDKSQTVGSTSLVYAETEGEDLRWYEWFDPIELYAGEGAYLLCRQFNGDGAPRLWWATGSYLHCVPLSQDLDLFTGTGSAPGNLYGESANGASTSNSGKAYHSQVMLPSRALFRELRLVIEKGAANWTWGLSAIIDGANEASIGSTLTASGSIFWTAGTNDEGQTIAPIITLTYTSQTSNNPPRLRRATLEGYYLPDVGDTVSMTIDLTKTATERKMTVGAVRAELLALRSAAYNFVDPWQATTTPQVLLVRDVQGAAPTKIAGEQGQAFALVTGEILEYA